MTVTMGATIIEHSLYASLGLITSHLFTEVLQQYLKIDAITFSFHRLENQGPEMEDNLL